MIPIQKPLVARLRDIYPKDSGYARICEEAAESIERLARMVEARADADREIATLRQAISEAQPRWRDADRDPPNDAQTVLACWRGSSCVEGMMSLTYTAADAPDGPEGWWDAWGARTDPPTHWTLLEMPK